jgi:hypothetical protein
MERVRDEKGRFIKGVGGGSEASRFKAGNTYGQGRPPLLCNVMKNLPQDAREKVHDALWTAISHPDVKSAQAYLQKAAEELPECGFVLQLAVKTLMGSKGWFALMDICDRLFGKPRQIAEIEGNFNLTPPPIIIEGEEE